MAGERVAALVGLIIGLAWIVFVCVPLAVAAVRVIISFWS